MNPQQKKSTGFRSGDWGGYKNLSSWRSNDTEIGCSRTFIATRDVCAGAPSYWKMASLSKSSEASGKIWINMSVCLFLFSPVKA